MSAAANSKRVVIPVSGMTCAACQARVQRTLSRTPGVADAAVNLMMGNATVAYDPAAVNPAALVDTIRATGYGAELPTPERGAIEEQAAHDAAQEAEFRGLRRKAIASAIAGAVAMVVSMPLAMRLGEGVTRVGLLVLTLAVMGWAGRHFYTG